MGSIRKDILTTLVNSKGLNIKSQYEFVWIVDFPLFNRAKNDHCALESTHHPFTQPHPDDIALLHSDPLKVSRIKVTCTDGSIEKIQIGIERLYFT